MARHHRGYPILTPGAPNSEEAAPRHGMHTGSAPSIAFAAALGHHHHHHHDHLNHHQQPPAAPAAAAVAAAAAATAHHHSDVGGPARSSGAAGGLGAHQQQQREAAHHAAAPSPHAPGSAMHARFLERCESRPFRPARPICVPLTAFSDLLRLALFSRTTALNLCALFTWQAAASCLFLICHL